MSKIVCDICGTQYDEAEGSCPVCGWNQTDDVPADADDFDVDFLDEIEEDAAPAAPAAKEVKNKVALDLESVNNRRRPAPKPVPKKQEVEDDDDEDEEDEDEEESGSNAFLVIILVILILALLAVSAYIGWTKIIKPRGDNGSKPTEGTVQVTEDWNQGGDQTVPTEMVTEYVEVTETTESAIPCTDIALAGNVDTLFIGQYWRLMAKATPENTTDKVVYTSSDPAVVTIDEYGRVTAVGEGKAVITVSCGTKSLEAPVVVKASETDVQTTTAPTAAAPAEGTSGNTAESSPAGTTVATPSSSSFSLKKHDITIGRLGVYVTLEVEGGVSAEDIKWSTSDSGVASVYNGNVTCVGRGICIITAEYNGQTEQCIVRCKY